MWSKVLDHLDYRQELSPGRTAVLFRGRQSFAIVSYHHLTAILDLRQHSPHIVVTGISVQNVFLRQIRVRQDGRPHQVTLEVVNCSAVLYTSTANKLPLLSAGLAAEQFLQSRVCTVDSTLPTPGTLAIQGSRQRRPSPSQPVPSRGRWRLRLNQLRGPGT